MRRIVVLLALAVILLFLNVSWPWIIGSIALLAVILFFVLDMVALTVEKKSNRVLQKPPYKVSEEVINLHRKQFMVDLHADPLLWKRDLLKRYDYGHIDLPRLVEGGVGLQVFGLVTKSPKGQNFESNSSRGFDNITLLACLSAWPPRTWNNLTERALYEMNKLHTFSEKSNGRLKVIKTVADLDVVMQGRQKGKDITGGLLSLEGTHALEGKIENLDLLFDRGLRMVGMTHFFDNEAGGSAHGLEKQGLSTFGRSVVEKAYEKHMVIDLAHASPRMVDDVLAMTKVPLVVSHTGVRGTADNVRNLSDKHIKGVAAVGGVMGIAMFDQAIGETSFDAMVKAIQYVVDLAGIDYVAVGGDLDGVVEAPVDVSGMPLLTEYLMKAGFTDEEIGKILGGNAVRVLRQVLPQA